MNNFLLLVLIGLAAFGSLSLYLLVVQLVALREIIEDWTMGEDEEDDDEGGFLSSTPDPYPPDGEAMIELRSVLAKQPRNS